MRLNLLRAVKVIDTIDTKPEVTVIKFLLAKSLMLVRMVVELRKESRETRLE